MLRWHKSDLLKRMYCNLTDGRKIAMPRYYKDKVYTEDERKKIAFFAAIDGELRELENERLMVEKYGDDYYRMKVEYDIYSFQKMYTNAERERNVF